MPLKPLERKASFAGAVVLHETTQQAACKELGVSWTHLHFCFLGNRQPSEELMERVAEYVGVPVGQFWGALWTHRSQSPVKATA